MIASWWTRTGDAWSGARLFAHLVTRIAPASPHLPLNLHTLHSLVASRPTLLSGGRRAHRALLDALDRLVSDDVPTRSGRDRVAGLLYALKIADKQENRMTDEGASLAAFGYELGVLKRTRRTGWTHAGVRDPEAVAEHTMRVAQLAALIAAQEGGDPARAAHLALWHDTQETRTGDLPHTIAGYVDKPDPRRITADQTAGLPEPSRAVVRAAVEEYEAGQTVEARCARDADKLEMLLQAVEYRETGVARVDGWVESASRGIRTTTGREIARAAVGVSPLAWRDR